jgi:hypothetical protein
MPENPGFPPQDLPSALSSALERAVGTSLNSLHQLRGLVIGYARRQHEHDVPLNDVIVAIGRLLMTAEDDAAPRPSAAPARDPELARQVRAWCAEGYAKDRRLS